MHETSWDRDRIAQSRETPGYRLWEVKWKLSRSRLQPRRALASAASFIRLA